VMKLGHPLGTASREHPIASTVGTLAGTCGVSDWLRRRRGRCYRSRVCSWCSRDLNACASTIGLARWYWCGRRCVAANRKIPAYPAKRRVNVAWRPPGQAVGSALRKAAPRRWRKSRPIFKELPKEQKAINRPAECSTTFRSLRAKGQ